ncbi:MAG TPA: MMPL family transporter [Mycobacterium sp.]|nr:MMPL family transporter [Mycobacterium sp.]HUH70486.1 MMPL family transporter [Mycobacterium sp.]
MLQAIAKLAIARPRRIIAAALLITVGAAIFGLPVVKSLPAGGFRDPTSESWHASRVLSDKFGHGDMQLVIAVKSDAGAQSPAARTAGTGLVTWLYHFPFVSNVKSAWTAPPRVASALVSKDGNTGLVVAGITGGEAGAQKHAAALAHTVPHFDDVTITVGGEVMGYVQVTDQTKNDLLLMEAIAFPLMFVALVWVFGGVLAAALPLAVGGFAIVGSMAVLRAISCATDVSVFALNLTLAMGLALSVDYTLLVISRFRDELAAGAAPDEALVRTMATAGRTVLFSATTVALSMVALALFPMYFLKSFAYAGVAVVALAAFAAVVLTPAAIVLLGNRLDTLDVRHAIRRALRRPEPLPRPVQETGWYRWSKFVMRHAVPAGVLVMAVLFMLGAPLLGIRWGFPDDRVLPRSFSARQLGDELRSGFAVNSQTDVFVVMPDVTEVPDDELDSYAADLSRIPDVVSVSSPAGTFVHGRLVGAPVAATGSKDGSAFFTVSTNVPLFSEASEAQLARLHAVTPPAGRAVELTGRAQINHDSSTAVTSRVPLVLSIIAAIAFVLLYLLTGSFVLPAKALILNVLSLSAAFGALVWIFQDGHLGALGTTATGTLVANIPVLLFCMAFGLSMDYEVFLIARIREYWIKSAKTRADNDESVALGVARTGRVVTAAALLMAITFTALTSAQVSFMRMFGLGVTLAVLVDATLVRMVLLPAFMHVLGRLNWWAPARLTRLYQRIGISESDDLSELPSPGIPATGAAVA